MTVRTARFADLDAATLYALLRLRVDVFVVEQRAPYPELDGRDLEPGTVHCWIEEGAVPVAYLRLLAESGGGTRISRVVTAPEARGRGLAARLLETALDLAEPPVALYAQAYLQSWYERFGFAVSGEPFSFDEDDIVHVPMTLR